MRLLVPAGTYVFESRVRTAGVVPLAKDSSSKGVGAGIRQSQKQARKQQEFTVTAEDEETVLLCELRAEKGEAWFDLDSMKLRRKPKPTTQ